MHKPLVRVLFLSSRNKCNDTRNSLLPLCFTPDSKIRPVTTLESRRSMRNSRRLCKQAPEARVTRGVWGRPPEKILKFRVAEMPFPAFSRGISKENTIMKNIFDRAISLV